MNQFNFQYPHSKELESFPHICEFALFKNSTIQQDSFVSSSCDTMQIYCIVDGKFDWLIDEQRQTLYPGNVALVLPGQKIGGSKGVLDIGTLFKLYVKVLTIEPGSSVDLGDWSSL